VTFPTTRWNLVLASGDPAASRAAWNTLAQRYRAPIHAYFRARYGADQADDLTSAFFAESISGDWWARADVERGSFHTYLRVLLQRFGARHAKTHVPSKSDSGLDDLPDATANPESCYDREFAHSLVERALVRLRSEHGDDEALLELVLERGDQGRIKQLAAQRSVAHNTLIQRLRRMRMRLRELLREEFADLVTDPSLIDSELATMQQTLSRD